ncbi:MAG: hypothetical protein FVQ78_05340 [Solirubrobacterales bacterium]|nr:hypothetical protein [Solirubrobacterales bacterium]
MATQLDSTPESEASGLAFERFRDALEGRASGYPRGAIFVPSDAPYTRKTLLRALREGQPVVLVFPDGQERIVHGETRDEGGWLSGMRDRLVSLRGLLH